MNHGGVRFLHSAAMEMTEGASSFSVIWGVRFLHFASVEMTGGVLAATVISSGAACRYRRQMENVPMIL